MKNGEAQVGGHKVRLSLKERDSAVGLKYSQPRLLVEAEPFVDCLLQGQADDVEMGFEIGMFG